MAAAPNGHLFVTTNGNTTGTPSDGNTLFNVNPMVPTPSGMQPPTLAKSVVHQGGVAVNGDGSKVYTGVISNQIFGYDTMTGVQVVGPITVGTQQPGVGAPGIQGIAFGPGSLSNSLFVNVSNVDAMHNPDEQVYQIDLLPNGTPKGTPILIADGGMPSNGDVAPLVLDLNNNTLLIANTDSIIRLTVPEPGFLPLAAVFILVCRRRRSYRSG